MKKARRNEPLPHLAILKMKLVNEDDFHAIYSYFFDHLGENDAFMRMGKQKRNKRLEQVLAVAAQEALMTERAVMQNMFFIYLRGHRFTHGAAQINGYLASYIYFADIDVGMLALSPFPGSREESKFVRFSMHELGGKPKPFPN